MNRKELGLGPIITEAHDKRTLKPPRTLREVLHGGDNQLEPGTVLWLEGFEEPWIVGDINPLGGECDCCARNKATLVTHVGTISIKLGAPL